MPNQTSAQAANKSADSSASGTEKVNTSTAIRIVGPFYTHLAKLAKEANTTIPDFCIRTLASHPSVNFDLSKMPVRQKRQKFASEEQKKGAKLAKAILRRVVYAAYEAKFANKPELALLYEGYAQAASKLGITETEAKALKAKVDATMGLNKSDDDTD